MSELNALWIPTRSGNSIHCYIKSEADKVINELKEECRWRKCSEELPDKDKFVLAFCPSLGSIEIARIIDDEWRDFSWNFLDITHWMPLPAAPRDEFKHNNGVNNA